MTLVPDVVFDQHIIILGKTRSGKSSVMRGFVEHLLDQKKPVCIVDPKGDWWGLKSSANGKEAGYPVVIFGGEHGDVPLNSKSGATVAELAATENRPCIVDLGGWMPGARTEFWIDFSSTFFRMSRGRRWLAIDEVHNVCPKGKIMDPNAGKMLHWSNRLASEGLGKGIALIAASQRPQKVHNDFLTSCETLIAMRVIHKADRTAIEDWIDGCGDANKGPEVVNALASMKRGEAWVWSPEAEFGPKRLQFPMFSTYDSFKPQNVQHPMQLKGWAEVDLSEVKKRLEVVIKEAEANDPEKLKKQIRELRAQLRAQPTVEIPKLVTDHKAIERAVRQAVAETEMLYKVREAAQKRYQQQTVQIARELRTLAEKMAKAVGVEIPPMPKIITRISSGEGGEGQKLNEKKPEVHRQVGRPIHHPYREMSADQGNRQGNRQGNEQGNGDHKLRAGAERMLTALAQWSPGGMSEGQMRAHAGLKKSGTYSAYMSDLRRGQYIEERDGMVYASDSGLEYCEHVPAAPSTTEEVLAIWNPKLRDGARRMLNVLVQRGGETIDKEALGEAAGLQKSGTFSAYLSDLKTARLITIHRDGTVAANKETLFL